MHRNISLSLPAVLAFSLFLSLSPFVFGQAESILYTFPGGANGSNPYGNLIFDASGNLYGTTAIGGSRNLGTVFELSPSSGGRWTETVLYSFGQLGEFAVNPASGLVSDSSGNFYGVSGGGTNGYGAVYEVSPASGGGWTERDLYSFNNGTDLSAPTFPLVFDGSGNLYGVTSQGGTNSMGGVFELSPASGGTWNFSVILEGNTANGGNFLGPVVFDSQGSMYVEAGLGGTSNAGTVYCLTHGSGTWKANVIYRFQAGTSDGYQPVGGLTFVTPNRLLGVTQFGGANNSGGIAF